MTYPIFKLSKKTGMLILWDGPSLAYSYARRILKQRQKKYPKDKFFIVRWEHGE